MTAAGVNAKSLQEFMIHASITITSDRQGHLMQGSHAEGAGLMDDYLSTRRGRNEDAACNADLSVTGA